VFAQTKPLFEAQNLAFAIDDKSKLSNNVWRETQKPVLAGRRKMANMDGKTKGKRFRGVGAKRKELRA
jgi:hypothetical protein